MKHNLVQRRLANMRQWITGLALAALVIAPFTVRADADPKITICHATSSDTNPYNTLHVSANATAGHFDNNGTPLAGHELDLLINDPNATCPTTGNITVVKNVVGGAKTASDFNLHLKRGATEVANSPFAGSTAGTSFNSITAGFFYNVSEDSDPNYTATFSGDCDANGQLTLRGGYDLTCTVTNTYNGGPIVNPSIDLAVSKTVDVANPLVNGNVVYTVSVTNNGPDDATNVVVSDALPAGATYVSNTTVTGSYNNITGNWTIGSLVNGGTATLTITATASGAAGNKVTNTATATAAETDSNNANNTASVDMTPRALGAASVDVAVNKTVNDSTLTANSNAVYTITVTNNGPDDATGVVLTDLLPVTEAFSTSVVSGGTYNSTTGDWTIGALANGASATMTLTGKINSGTAVGTVITNTATAVSNESDSNPANNTDSVDVTVIRNSSGGGGGGGSVGGSINPPGQVLGESTNIPYIAPETPAPTGQVLGESTTQGKVLGESTGLPVTGNTTAWIWAVLGIFGLMGLAQIVTGKIATSFTE